MFCLCIIFLFQLFELNLFLVVFLLQLLESNVVFTPAVTFSPFTITTPPASTTSFVIISTAFPFLGFPPPYPIITDLSLSITSFNSVFLSIQFVAVIIVFQYPSPFFTITISPFRSPPISPLLPPTAPPDPPSALSPTIVGEGLCQQNYFFF